ncbi:MAG: DMT family transporter [Armatimonadetes bacterium]|nr:DMT family transporter [Armatimonadota bacterium]
MISPAPPQPDPRGGAGPALPAPPRAPLSARAALLLLGINALWGGSSLAAKIALTHVPPMTLAFARFGLAAVLLYALAGVLRVDLRVRRRDWRLFWAMGGVGLALTYLLYYAGVCRTTAADAALLTAAEPVFLAVLSVVLLRERLPAAKIAGIAFGLLGVVLIVSRGGRLPHGGSSASGDLLITLGLVCEALAVIIGKRLLSRYPAVAVITYQMLAGAVILGPFAFAEIRHTGWRPTLDAAATPAYLGVLYLVLCCTALAYTVWYTLLDRRAASELSVFLFVQPVVGALLGVVFQHDPLTRATLAGAVLVLLGIALINRRPPDPTYLTPA